MTCTVCQVIKESVLRQLADNWVVLSLADATVNFNGMITLNESGALLWNTLEGGADADALVAALLKEYAVSEQQARADVAEFLDKLQSVGCLDQQ